MREKFKVRETFGLGEKETKVNNNKESLRRALGKRSHSQKLGFFWNYKVRAGN